MLNNVYNLFLNRLAVNNNVKQNKTRLNMEKKATIGFRTDENIKKLAEQTAKADRRNLSSYAEIALIEKLERDGALKPKKR